MKTSKTEIIAIIDRSGSMHPIAADSIGGFNRFIADQKAVPGKARVTLVLFNEQVNTVYAGQPINKAPDLTDETYTTRGGTALHDAVCMTLNAQGWRIADEKWADKVIVCILTDGHENQSREYNSMDVQRMIGHAEKHGWSFVFLAANQDAVAASKAIGITQGHSLNFAASGVGTQSAYASMSNVTRSLRAAPVDASAPASIAGLLSAPSAP